MGRSTTVPATLSVLPTTLPRATPPPARRPLYASDQWSRPPPLVFCSFGAGPAVLVPEHPRELAARLHQPPGGQAGLAEHRHAVGVAQGRPLALDVQGGSHLLRADQVVGHLAVAVVAAARLAGPQVAPGPV